MSSHTVHTYIPDSPPIRSNRRTRKPRYVSFGGVQHPVPENWDSVPRDAGRYYASYHPSSQGSSFESVHQPSETSDSERTDSLYGNSSGGGGNSSDDKDDPQRYYWEGSFTGQSKYYYSGGNRDSSASRKRKHKRGKEPMNSVNKPYDPTEDHHMIHPGLKTPIGSHQGSMPKAVKRSRAVRRLATKATQGNTNGGLITIKKLLSRTTIANAMKKNFSIFETPYDEIFLDVCEDKDAHNKLAPLVESAINLERSREPFEKEPSCAIIYLDNCTEAFKVLDEIFELKKSNWGAGDDGFIRWATGQEHQSFGNSSFRHSISRAGRNLLERTLPRIARDGNVHLSERIPESFCWEPFGFDHLLHLTKRKSDEKTYGKSVVYRSNVKRLMFTFEFLVPYTCAKRDCGEPRKLLQFGTHIHFHTFIQRRSVLVQSAVDAYDHFLPTPSHDNLCIIADMPVPTNGTVNDTNHANTSLDGSNTQAKSYDDSDEKLKLFYWSVGPSKYRFRPAFSLNPSSERWYNPALIYFILKEIIECWGPVVQACIEHVEFREQAVLQDVTLATHTRNLWEDKQHWIYLRTTLDAHIGNFSRLQSYISETFEVKRCLMLDMYNDLYSRFSEVERKIDKQIQERTANLVDLVFNSINSEDSHISAETGTSMWRLSWITFVFLPLTFLAGVFGMNVDVLADAENVNIKWYFVSAILMLLFVVAAIWVLKKDLGRDVVIFSALGIQAILNRVIKKMKKPLAPEDLGMDLESNSYLLSDIDSESGELPEIAVVGQLGDDLGDNKKIDDELLKYHEKGKNNSAQKIDNLEDTETREEPTGSGPAQDSTKLSGIGLEDPDKGAHSGGNSAAKDQQVLNHVNQVSSSTNDSQGSINFYGFHEEQDGDTPWYPNDVRRNPSRNEVPEKSEKNSNSASKPKIDQTSKQRGLSNGRDVLSQQISEALPEDTEDVRIKGSYQASIGGLPTTKDPKKTRSILSRKSLFRHPKGILHESVIELDTTPISQSSRFEPGKILFDLHSLPSSHDIKVRIVVLLGYSGYNALIHCDDRSSSTVIEINSVKQFCSVYGGKDYSDTIRYGRSYAQYGQFIEGRYLFNKDQRLHLTECDLLQPKKANIQSFYGVLLYFLSSIRPALEATYSVETTADKANFNPQIEISFVASQLMCAAEHIRDMITEFNEENPFNAKVVSLTPTQVAVDGLTASTLGYKPETKKHSGVEEASRSRPRFALLRREQYLWAYDLNSLASLDNKDERLGHGPDSSFRSEFDQFQPRSIHSSIEEYFGMLTRGRITWNKRDDHVCMEVTPATEIQYTIGRSLGLPRYLKPWQDQVLEQFDWLLTTERDTCQLSGSHQLRTETPGRESDIRGIPRVSYYPSADDEVAPFYTDVNFETTEKVVRMTEDALIDSVRQLVDGTYAKQSDKDQDGLTRAQPEKQAKGHVGHPNQEFSTKVPLVVLVGNIGDDTTEQPLPPNMWNKIKTELDGEVDLQMFRGRDIVASVMGFEVVHNAQRKMVFDITTGRLWEYPNVVTVEDPVG